MAQAREVFYLHGERVRELRKLRGLTQQEFALRSEELRPEISRRTLQIIESNERPVGREVLDSVARVLACKPIDLVAEKMLASPPTGRAGLKDDTQSAWVRLPKVSPDQSQKLADAVCRAMTGRPDQAARICRQVLRTIPKTSSFEDYATVLVKLVTFLDEAGRHREAIKLLDGFFADLDSGYSCSLTCRLWAEYHKGICYRRLAEEDPDLFATARSIFERLTVVGGDLSIAAVHQLGVICLKQGVQASEILASGLFEEAERLFLKAYRDGKRKAGGFREGFPLRRLGQLYALKGRFPEALEKFMEALIVFVQHRAERYVNAVRRDIHAYISSRALMHKETRKV